MQVTTKTERTYCIEVTEHQARALLNVCLTYSEWLQSFPDAEKTDEQREQNETLNTLRQALLTTELKKDLN